jgi:hypothetical protein
LGFEWNLRFDFQRELQPLRVQHFGARLGLGFTVGSRFSPRLRFMASLCFMANLCFTPWLRFMAMAEAWL